MLVFAPGIPVVIVAVYFFAFPMTEKIRLIGVGVVMLFLGLHIIITGVAAHSDRVLHLPLQFSELGLALGIVLFARWLQQANRAGK